MKQLTKIKSIKFSEAQFNSLEILESFGSRGDVFFTFTNLQLDQKDTQSQTSGITDMYQRYATY